ncbi:CIA30 family protein [Chloracidobacterium thermophilum]|uniref:Complex I intermediate-associated protein 30 (CIA30) n=2 Tax=Chloracidobacterium thermophilum TaxID=458033 RepID=G2LLK2_CHLTF|nr:Complex I intermediate-associated protein 30 (CIA30) [Chloracidobacterium thermophilum B]QUV80249.1 CIA30 family protein [Chloracidobacterium thermophilum]
MMVVFDFADPTAATAWYAIGDQVMGGCSSGQLRPTNHGFAVFEGVVSLANHGGFASVRSAPLAQRLPPQAVFVIEVRGDGKTYRFVVRTDANFDGLAYQATFTPAPNTWQTCRFAATDFVPTFRGRPVPAPPLRTEATTTVGLMIAGKQAGPFALALRRLVVLTEA